MKGLTCFLLFAALSACTNTEEVSALLTNPPYAKLTDSIRQQPQNAALFYNRGVLLYQNNEFAAARHDLRQAWNLQPSEQHALSLVTLLIKINPDSAIRFIQQALPELPKSIALQLGLARGYQQNGALQQALDACDQVLLFYPASLDALLLKAEILKSQQQDGEALTTLEKAYSLAPFDQELAYNLAFAYAEARNQKVLPLTDSLMKADTTGRQAQPYYLRGVYFANTGNNSNALAYFNQAIAHDYTFLDAHMDKGAFLYDAKKYKEALQAFQLAARISPTYAEGYYWMGKSKEALGQRAEAKLDYQRAFGLDKNLTAAKDAAAKL